MIQSPVVKSLYNFATVNAEEVAQVYPNGIQDICDRQIDGLIIENILYPTEIGKVVSQLNRKGPLEGSPFGDILIYGPALYVSSEDTGKYCQEAVEFRHFCRQLFSGGRDFERRMSEVLSTLSGGRVVELPKAADGSEYTPASIRVLETDQFMGWHFENQFLHCTPGYRELINKIELSDHLAYFVVLSDPEAGGELVLYDIQWHETEWTDRENGGRGCNGTINGRPLAEVMEEYSQMTISPKPGSLVIFDGGRILHRVSAVKGKRRRITIGGFVAFSRQREKVFYWS